MVAALGGISCGGVGGRDSSPPRQLLKALLSQQPHSLKRMVKIRNTLPLLPPLRSGSRTPVHMADATPPTPLGTWLLLALSSGPDRDPPLDQTGLRVNTALPEEHRTHNCPGLSWAGDLGPRLQAAGAVGCRSG